MNKNRNDEKKIQRIQFFMNALLLSSLIVQQLVVMEVAAVAAAAYCCKSNKEDILEIAKD
jgi:hypothetical protein